MDFSGGRLAFIRAGFVSVCLSVSYGHDAGGDSGIKYRSLHACYIDIGLGA